MKQWILNRLKPLIGRMIIKKVKDERQLIIDVVNKKVDLPKLDEAEEARLLGEIYDCVEELAKAYLTKI